MGDPHAPRDSEVFQALHTVPGIGKALALTIALESGDMSRFASAGNFASYARTVDSRRESNGKNKGQVLVAALGVAATRLSTSRISKSE
jgi:transposase